MSNTPEEDNGDYLSLRQLHEALTKDYGLKISLSTLSEYAKKGIIKPDYSTSDKLLYLKVRVPGIADLLKTIKTNPQLLAEQQLSQQPIVVPLKQDQEQPEQIPDITALDLTKQILARLTALEKQYQDQQLEIHNVKMQIVDLETEFNNKIKDLKKEETDDYNHLIDVINKQIDSINELKEYLKQHVVLKLQSLEEELDQFEREYIRRYGY
jgi:flagellar biosynthesis regulator FlaF